MRKLVFCLTAVAVMLGLSGCGLWRKIHYDDAQYWQRRELRDSFHMDGAAKQQWLNRDLAACIADMKELQVSGGLREAIPNDKGGDGAPAVIAEWDSPERENYLLMEHKDFPDFEVCMRSKGWERVSEVPYPVAEESIETYKESRGIKTERQERAEKARKAATPQSKYYFNL